MATMYRLRTTITSNGVPSLLTTYWTTSNPVPDNATATEAAARVRAMLNSAAARFLASTTVSYDVNVQILTVETGELVNVATATPPAAVTFTGVGNVMPGQTQGLARLGTSNFVRGRALKGRIFLPGVIQGDNTTTGVPGSTYISSWNTALGLLGTTIVTPISQIVWSRPTAPGAADGSAGPVTSRSTAATWAVQRSRRA